MKKPVIGVLALQGCVRPHKPHIEALGAEFVEVRRDSELDLIDGLILPGGESTTMLKLIDTFSLESKLEDTFKRVPVWGICAGTILMARKVFSPSQKSFGLLDVEVERNSYGRQLESFNEKINECEVSFIRAPRILKVGKDVQVLASYSGSPVWIQQGRFMATTFHPELSLNTPSVMHQRFASLLRK